jgi:hypothetical protein
MVEYDQEERELTVASHFGYVVVPVAATCVVPSLQVAQAPEDTLP